MIDPEKVKGQDLLEAFPHLLDGKFPGAVEDDKGEAASAWLRWSQSGSPNARVQWAYLQEHPEVAPDRDAFVLKLWQTFDSRTGTNRRGREFVEEICPWSYYQRHFFGWFLSRFDVLAASSVMGNRDLVLRGQVALLGASFVIAALYFELSRKLNRIELVGGLAAFGILLAVWWAVVLVVEKKGFPRWAFVQAGIPRLGAAVGIGYLFLASASELVSLLYRSGLSGWLYGVILAGSLAAALGYVMHHIERRVHPPLSPSQRRTRALHLILLAITYAFAGLPLAVPLFFSRGFLGLRQGEALEVGWRHVALVAAVALNLGVILQLAWDEKPLTEPL